MLSKHVRLKRFMTCHEPLSLSVLFWCACSLYNRDIGQRQQNKPSPLYMYKPHFLLLANSGV